MISPPAAITRLPKSLKVAGGIVAATLTALELVAVIAWAGAPAHVAVPVWIGLLLTSWAASRPRRRPRRSRGKTS